MATPQHKQSLNPPSPRPVDSSNRFQVGTNASGTVIRIHAFNQLVTFADALNLAAWLVALADPARAQFDPLLDSILET